MSYTMNPELAERMQALMPALEKLPEAQPGDALAWRKRTDAFYVLLNEGLPDAAGIACTDVTIPFEGRELRARWYQNNGSCSQGAVLFVHGGGGVAGSMALYHKVVKNYVAHSGVRFLSLDYDLAPEVPGQVQAAQALAALQWLQNNSGQFAIDPARVVLMGDSGGGGIVASTAILARDTRTPLAGQILIYPMLDNETHAAASAIEPFLTINAQDVKTAWQARIPPEVSEAQWPLISPARLQDFTGLAAVYMDVGELDLFCQENQTWMQKLVAAGVPVEFHIYAGVNHGFELVAPHSSPARQAMQLRSAAIQRLTA